MRGAVAGGSPVTVEAGLEALRRGGNAVDAIVAASLAAEVAEPLLAGLGGAGIALVRFDGRVEAWDLFADAPGLGLPPGRGGEMVVVDIDFGPTTQRFRVGPASVAVPGMPAGLAALHAAHGRLPLRELAEPALRAAEAGLRVPPGFERVCRLLWPILELTEESRRMFGRPGGGPLRAGDRFHAPELAVLLERFAEEGGRVLSGGAVGRAALEALGPDTRLTAEDLAAWRPRRRRALRLRYRDATVWVPPPPSQAGLLVLHALAELDRGGPMPEPGGADELLRVDAALRRAEERRDREFLEGLADRDFVGRLLTGMGAGFTTHISAVDADGNAVALTQSLGETCGVVVPGLGLRLNNFLGEEDVAPPGLPRRPGQRLLTMCCPTLLEHRGTLYAMGSGGSSRIRSAVLHGVLRIVDHGMAPAEAVAAPRAHVEWGVLHVETWGRPPRALEAVESARPELKRFDGPNMFFGGLHVAAVGPDGFAGAGDDRRSGEFGVA